jgi:predicted HicB family RNase H-like nuclease
MENIKKHSTYPLRLPRSIKAEVERLAKQDGISINQFIATAAADRPTTLPSASDIHTLPRSTRGR